MSQKFQKVSDQLANHSAHTLDLDRSLQKHVQAAVSQVVEAQMREKVMPAVLGQMKGVERAIREEVMPKVEREMGEMVERLVKSKRIATAVKENGEAGEEEKRGEEEQIRSIVVEEFA